MFLAAEDRSDAHHEAAGELLRATADSLMTLDLALYEVTNVAIRAWRDGRAAQRLRARILAVGDDGGMVRADEALMTSAASIAEDHGISVYDAAYVAAATSSGAALVSCDLRDLVSRGLAQLP